MEEITLEDGSVREILTEEERTELQTKASKVDEYVTQEEEHEKTKTELEELRNQPGAEGIKNLREQNKRLKSALKGKDVEVDDEGNVVEKPQHLTAEEVDQRATAVYEKKAVSAVLTKKKASLDEDSQAVFDKEYEFLTEGKEVTGENVEKYITAAMASSGLFASQTPSDPLSTFSGSGPAPMKIKKESYASTEKGKEAGQILFGKDNLIK